MELYLNKKEGKDFQIVEHPFEPTHSSIIILEGPYTNVKYSYGRVNFEYDETKDKPPRISFSFNIINVPLNLEEENLQTDQNFRDEVIDILDALLYSDESKIGNLNINTNNDEND